MSLRALVLTPLLLGGCVYTNDRISDAELRRTGAWAEGDAAARQLLLRSRRAKPAELGALPLRRATGLRRGLDPLTLFGVTVPVPDLGALVGFDYQERAWVLPSRNAVVILHGDRPPTVLPLDPERPVDLGEPETDERVFQRLRRTLQRDLRGLPPRPKPEARPEP